MKTQPKKDLLQKLIELEKSQKRLEQETSWLQISKELRQRSQSPAWRKSAAASSPPLRIQDSINLGAEVGGWGPSATDKQYLNILQSMGQSVQVFDTESRIIFWNAMAEKQFGYSAAEVVGRNPVNLVVGERDVAFANTIIQNCFNGECWSGEFPIRTRSGDTFSAITTVSPFYDDEGSLVGIISLTSNAAFYLHPTISLARSKEEEGETSSRNTFASKLGLDSDQPIKVAISSKISSLASKVRSKMRASDSSVTLSEGDSDHSEHDFVSAANGASTPRGDIIHSPFGVFTFTYDDAKFPFKGSSNGNSALCKALTSKAEEWIAKKPLPWPWKGNEQEGRPREAQYEQEKYNEASSPWSSSINVNSTSSWGSTNNSVMYKVDTYSDSLDDEMLWDDLAIGEGIGQGDRNSGVHAGNSKRY